MTVVGRPGWICHKDVLEEDGMEEPSPPPARPTSA